MRQIVSNQCWFIYMAAGFIGSISIEMSQLLESIIGGMNRITDIDDVIFNVIGCMIGFFIYKVTFMVVGFRDRYKEVGYPSKTAK